MSLENKYFVASFFILFIVLFGIIYAYRSAKRTGASPKGNKKEDEDEGKRLCISAIISIVASLFIIGVVYGYFYYRQHHVKVYMDGDFYDD